MSAIAEIACSEAAIHFINDYATKKKLNQLQVAIRIPGIVHTHAATERMVDECIYCQRNGNVFSVEQQHTPLKKTDDIISRYRKRVEEIFKEMEEEILQELKLFES
jgi:hypothetical protein